MTNSFLNGRDHWPHRGSTTVCLGRRNVETFAGKSLLNCMLIQNTTLVPMIESFETANMRNIGGEGGGVGVDIHLR